MEKQRILVVDDEVDLARLVVEILEDEGYRAEAVYTGEDGLAKARQTIPNLIILDWKLPDMEGIDVCRVLKQEEATESIPVVMLTSQSSEKDKIKGLETGADDYMTKPFGSGELVARVKAILRRTKQREKTTDDRLGLLQKYMPKELADRIVSGSRAIEGERRNVTVLLADLSGFTALSEKLDPEQVRSIINDCFGILARSIYKYEGIIDKFIGDAIMALFGVPLTHEDDPQRALKAALELMELLEKFNTERHPPSPLKMRIGVNTGMVVAGAVGSDLKMEYTVMGDTVNLTARLQSAAEPGQILAAQNTYRRAVHDFVFQQLKPISVKGKEEPVNLYLVVSEKPHGEIPEEFGKLKMPQMVGRDRELELLKNNLELTKQGHGLVVSVSGGSGLGKSRLIYEFQRFIPADSALFLKARCQSLALTKPYAVFQEIISGLSKFLNQTPPDLAGIEKIHVYDTLKQYIDKATQTKPLVMMIEDLEFIDDQSRELLNYIVDLLPERRVLLVCTYKQEFSHSWAEKTHYRDISLQELSEEELSRMLNSMLLEDKLSPELKTLVISHAEGNPLFLEEIVKSLVDSGTIQKKNESWFQSKDISEIPVPETISAVLLSRLDRLGEKAKRILQLASVIGRTFKYNMLKELYPDEVALKEQLSRLQQLEVVFEKSVYPEKEYIFKHELTREVMYDSLLITQREELSRKIKGMMS